MTSFIQHLSSWSGNTYMCVPCLPVECMNLIRWSTNSAEFSSTTLNQTLSSYKHAKYPPIMTPGSFSSCVAWGVTWTIRFYFPKEKSYTARLVVDCGMNLWYLRVPLMMWLLLKWVWSNLSASRRFVGYKMKLNAMWTKFKTCPLE